MKIRNVKPKKKLDAHELAKELLGGSVVALAQAITMVESDSPMDEEQSLVLLNEVLPHAGKSIRIGITGVPGVGKSSFIEAFGSMLCEQGLKVAVLAVDPSSEISKGSILGDKTRMEQLSSHPNAFIRPSASKGSLGGIALKTRESIFLCEAAGYDVIVIETVGVGQSEIAVAHLCDFFLLLMLAGAGDELQGIKKGIMEMADALVITKADTGNEDDAIKAAKNYRNALHLFPRRNHEWEARVAISSALNHSGIENVWKIVEKFKSHVQANGYFEKNRADQSAYWFKDAFNESVFKLLNRQESFRIAYEKALKEVIGLKKSPAKEAVRLIKNHLKL